MSVQGKCSECNALLVGRYVALLHAVIVGPDEQLEIVAGNMCMDCLRRWAERTPKGVG